MRELVRRPSRLQALASLSANAETSAEALDRIAGIACRVLDAPVAIVNLVGSDRQHFIGCDGDFEAREMPIEAGFCPFALGAERAYAFSDAHADPELANNPAVEKLGVVAYAGVPLRDVTGEPVGTLCAVDTEPHEWTDEDLTTLTDLAASAVSELQLLAATRHAARQQSRVEQLAALGTALVSAAGSPEQIAERLLPVVAAMGARGVWLLTGAPLQTVAAAGPDREWSPLDDAVAVVETREPRHVSAPGRSAALLPLAGGGVLCVAFEADRILAPDDRAHLAALAAIAGLALAR
jgi:GAF domain